MNVSDDMIETAECKIRGNQAHKTLCQATSKKLEQKKATRSVGTWGGETDFANSARSSLVIAVGTWSKDSHFAYAVEFESVNISKHRHIWK